MPHDFCDIQSPRFEYRVNGQDGKPVDVSVDMDAAMIELNMAVPTALRPTQEQAEDGSPKSGLQKVFECLRDGTPLPACLPSMPHVLDAARRALRVPQHLGIAVVSAVFMQYLADMAERAARGKDTPVSPGSPAPTPAA